MTHKANHLISFFYLTQITNSSLRQ